MQQALAALGWSEIWQRKVAALPQADNLIPARVIRQERSSFLLDTGSCERRAETSGNVKHQEQSALDRPLVGDWVLIEDVSAPATAVIRELLPRSSALLRRRASGQQELQPLAANIELALIVVALDRPLDLELLERAVAMARAGEIEPCIVLSKVDVCPEFAALLTQTRAHFSDLTVLPLSTKSGLGLELLREVFPPQRTAVLLGPSGAGKSSLANRLLGAEVMKTSAVRSYNQEGKHTTTHRQLLRLPDGGLLIDGPGLRDFRS